MKCRMELALSLLHRQIIDHIDGNQSESQVYIGSRRKVSYCHLSETITEIVNQILLMVGGRNTASYSLHFCEIAGEKT